MTASSAPTTDAGRRLAVSAAWLSKRHDCTLAGIHARCHAACCTSGPAGSYWPARAFGDGPSQPCGNLGPDGCRLSQADKPVTCLLYPATVNANGTLVLHSKTQWESSCCKGNHGRGPALIDALRPHLVELFGEGQVARVREDVLAGRNSYFDVPPAVAAAMDAEAQEAEMNTPPVPRSKRGATVIVPVEPSPAAAAIRNRVKELREVRASDLRPHPANWRRHPEAQRRAMISVLEELGYADVLLTREQDDGSLQILDGHLRAETTPDMLVPVVVTDLSEAEGEVLLATLDPLAAMAKADSEAIRSLLDKCRAGGAGVEALLQELRHVYAYDGTGVPLSETFGAPPWTVLDARAGYWQDRKAEWWGLGLDPQRDRPEITHHGQRHAGRHSVRNRLSGRLARDLNDQTTIISIFDPVLAELMLRWFCPPGGHVLDPFAGDLAEPAVSVYLGYAFLGIDLRDDQIMHTQQQIAKVMPDRAHRAQFVCGDSLEVLPAMTHEFDFILTCPPYGPLEIYTDDPRDLSTMDVTRFEEAYAAILRHAFDRLKPDRFGAVVVGDFRMQGGGPLYNLAAMTIRALARPGYQLYNAAVFLQAIGSKPLLVAYTFPRSRAMLGVHEQVLLFCKGDPKRAHAACGPVSAMTPLETAGEAG